MRDFEIGVKIYSDDWFLKHALDCREAAQRLRDWGITSVLAKSSLLYSTVENAAGEASSQSAGPGAGYDDRKFRESLANEGIEYWATVCTFFDPPAIEAHPSLRPIGSDGRPMEQIDWYIGIPPSREAFVARQVANIERAVKALEPDGVFLSFIRWPGFWELWMPHHTRQDFPEYSYDTHSLDRFAREANVDAPTRDPAEAASWIETHARQAWTTWKCQVVTDVVRQVREACLKIKPDLQIMLNTLPFGAEEFDGAREKVFGQRLTSLKDVVDVFEVMTYHQILKRPTEWIVESGEDVKRRTGRKTVCTLQAKPIYLDGIYAKDRRSPTLDAEEFAQAAEAVANSSLDGLMVFAWSDLLQEALEQGDARRVDAIRAASERRRA